MLKDECKCKNTIFSKVRSKKWVIISFCLALVVKCLLEFSCLRKADAGKQHFVS